MNKLNPHVKACDSKCTQREKVVRNSVDFTNEPGVSNDKEMNPREGVKQQYLVNLLVKCVRVEIIIELSNG